MIHDNSLFYSFLKKLYFRKLLILNENQTLFSSATLEGNITPQSKLHDYYLKSIFEELVPADSI